jgi:hypothetical protein
MTRHHLSASSRSTESIVCLLAVRLSIGTAPIATEKNQPRVRLEKK